MKTRGHLNRQLRIMKVLSHRGYWKTRDERNTPAAFTRSFKLGFGTETDLRDLNGHLVISHDVPLPGALDANAFFDIHRTINPDLPLALNLKSCCLQPLLQEAIRAYAIRNYFLFDMAIPDHHGCLAAGLITFTRQSEYEREPVFYAQSAGVWIDAFNEDWYSEVHVARHLDAGKQVCIVSPELHARDPRPLWDKLAKMPQCKSPDLMICTDRPEEAQKLFDA